MKRFKISWALGLFFLLAASTSAAVPQLINFQGVLRDSGGNLVVDGSYLVSIKIYDAPTAGIVLWTETQSVTTSGGSFNVLLGATNAVPDSAFSAMNRYLGITVASDPEMSPRFQLVSVGYAYRVNSVDGALGGNITSKVSIGPGHTNTGTNTFVAGVNNSVTGNNTIIGGGFLNLASGSLSVIGGGDSNTTSGSSAFIGGGRGNTASREFSTIGGGTFNAAGGGGATVAGGALNVASGFASLVGGGNWNKARGIFSAVLGGGGSSITDSNSAIGDYSFIGGGRGNIAGGGTSAISGGQGNKASGLFSVIGGGGGVSSNLAIGNFSTVGGGTGNSANDTSATIAGGEFNTSGQKAAVGGGHGNNASGVISVIAGGEFNQATGGGANVGGGYQNNASASYAVVAGGVQNQANGSSSVIGGGQQNEANVALSTICGGQHNISTGGGGAAIGGGSENMADGANATIAGGFNNSANGNFSTVPGGNSNTAAGKYSFAAGKRAKANQAGVFVWADSTDADFASTGINQFLIRASGGVGIGTNSPEVALQVDQDAEVASFTGDNNQGLRISGTNTNDRWVLLGFDGGQGKNIAQIGSRQSGTGSFLSFGTSSSFVIGITNEAMTIDPNGQVGIGVPTPAYPLHLASGAHCTAGGTWTNASSRSYKTDIQPLRDKEYAGMLKKLENLEVVRFRYKAEPGREHIGLIAEDVPDEIASPDRKGIPTADAIAFLTAALKAQQAQIENLKETVKRLQKNR